MSAYLLQEQGYDVTGATFLTTGKASQNVIDAAAVCERLGIPHLVLDFRADFKRFVTDYFVAEYLAGRTPNPCVMCNNKIKFGKLFEYACQNGYDFIATGHYAGIGCEGGRYFIQKAASAKKDQSYFLYTLSSGLLARVLFPLGEYDKEDVRKLAADQKLPVSSKSDSQDVCFIPDGGHGGYIVNEYGVTPRPGCFVDENGMVLGEHKGIFNYTIGQRKGLGISLGRQVFVSAIDGKNNTVTLSDESALFSDRCEVKALCLNLPDGYPSDFAAQVKIRYAHQPSEARVELIDRDTARITFAEPQRAVTPGQSAVFYAGDRVLGGGIIQ